jgi:hypothetical protein
MFEQEEINKTTKKVIFNGMLFINNPLFLLENIYILSVNIN